MCLALEVLAPSGDGFGLVAGDQGIGDAEERPSGIDLAAFDGDPRLGLAEGEGKRLRRGEVFG
ncbi:MAG: hypothetical protein V9G15_13115 [Dermatophilaceae bacterium]